MKQAGANLRLALFLGPVAFLDAGHALAHPEQAGRSGGPATHEAGDEVLSLVGLRHQPTIREIDDAGGPPAIELLGDAERACLRRDIGFDQRISTTVGPQAPDIACRARMRLKEEGVEGLEARRLAEFVDGAEDIDAVVDAFDSHTAAGEAFYVEQTQGQNLHGVTVCA